MCQHMLLTPALWETDTGKLQIQAQQSATKTLTQNLTSAWDVAQCKGPVFRQLLMPQPFLCSILRRKKNEGKMEGRREQGDKASRGCSSMKALGSITSTTTTKMKDKKYKVSAITDWSRLKKQEQKTMHDLCLTIEFKEKLLEKWDNWRTLNLDFISESQLKNISC